MVSTTAAMTRDRHSFVPRTIATTNMPRSTGITDRRDEYKNIYREAYVHGYEKGYGASLDRRS